MVEDGEEIVFIGSEKERTTVMPAGMIVEMKYSSPGVCSFTELTKRRMLLTSWPSVENWSCVMPFTSSKLLVWMVFFCLAWYIAVTPVARAIPPTTRFRPPRAAPATLVNRLPRPISILRLGLKEAEGASCRVEITLS